MKIVPATLREIQIGCFAAIVGALLCL